MIAAKIFGYLLVAASGMLLAWHWTQWQAWRQARDNANRSRFVRLQVQRRSVASALIGVVGAAMTIIDYVPRTPGATTVYLLAMLLGGIVILAIAIADWRATRRRRDAEHFELLALELGKLPATPVRTPGDMRSVESPAK